ETVAIEAAGKVALDLGGLEVPGRAAGDAEALVEQRAVHPLNEAVGPRRVHARGAMLNAFQAQQQLVGMERGSPAKLAAVVSQDGADRDAERFVERQHTIVEQVAGGHRHLRCVALGEGQGTEVADALERSPEEGVLVEQLAGPGGLDMPTPKLDTMALQKSELFLGDDEGRLPHVALKAQESLEAG